MPVGGVSWRGTYLASQVVRASAWHSLVVKCNKFLRKRESTLIHGEATMESFEEEHTKLKKEIARVSKQHKTLPTSAQQVLDLELAYDPWE